MSRACSQVLSENHICKTTGLNFASHQLLGLNFLYRKTPTLGNKLVHNVCGRCIPCRTIIQKKRKTTILDPTLEKNNIKEYEIDKFFF